MDYFIIKLFNKLNRLGRDISNLSGFIQNELSPGEISDEVIKAHLLVFDSNVDDVIVRLDELREACKECMLEMCNIKL